MTFAITTRTSSHIGLWVEGTHVGIGLIRMRLQQRADSEHAQVFVRIAITFLFSLYLGWEVGSRDTSPGL